MKRVTWSNARQSTFAIVPFPIRCASRAHEDSQGRRPSYYLQNFHFQTGVVTLSRILRHPAARGFFVEHFRVLTGFPTTMDARQVLKNSPERSRSVSSEPSLS